MCLVWAWGPGQIGVEIEGEQDSRQWFPWMPETFVWLKDGVDWGFLQMLKDRGDKKSRDNW
jgi:hypothetical protein